VVYVEESGPQAAAAQVPAAGLRGPRRVVVLSPDQSFLRLMREVLGELGLEAWTHAEGDGPVRFTARVRPALVILDIGVGAEHVGWATLDGLKETPGTAALPVLVCAAAGRLLDERASLLRQDGLLTWREPFDLGDLVRAIQAGLDASRPSAQAWTSTS